MATVTFDGRKCEELNKGDVLRITGSCSPLPSLCVDDPLVSWFQQLAECLHWNRRQLPNTAFSQFEKSAPPERNQCPLQAMTISEQPEEPEISEMTSHLSLNRNRNLNSNPKQNQNLSEFRAAHSTSLPLPEFSNAPLIHSDALRAPKLQASYPPRTQTKFFRGETFPPVETQVSPRNRLVNTKRGMEDAPSSSYRRRGVPRMARAGKALAPIPSVDAECEDEEKSKVSVPPSSVIRMAIPSIEISEDSEGSEN